MTNYDLINKLMKLPAGDEVKIPAPVTDGIYKLSDVTKVEKFTGYIVLGSDDIAKEI